MGSRVSIGWLVLSTVACTASEGHDAPVRRSLELPELRFAEAVAGSIDAVDEDDRFGIELDDGFRIEIQMLAPEGSDLVPDFVLRRVDASGDETTVRAESYDIRDRAIDKTYAISTSGTYVLVARAFEDQGLGAYQLYVSALPGDPALLPELDACLVQTTDCALARVEGAAEVTLADMETAFAECLGETLSYEGNECDIVARGSAEFRAISEQILGRLADLALASGNSPGCVAELEDCLDECRAHPRAYDIADESLQYWTEAMCWLNGFNSTCEGYAASLEACGGELDVDSPEACGELVEATTGVWIDDLDVMVEETCDL